MSQAFLSSLALHVSLHPSCRAELRHHWPAPHYHKTPHNVFEEAEEQLRCHAAGASSAASLTAVTIGGPDGSRKGGGVREFNPYETFSLRLQRKGKTQVKPLCQGHGSDAAPQQQQTTTEVSQSKAKRRMSSSSPRLRSASSAARVGSTSPPIANSLPRARVSKLSDSAAANFTPATSVDSKAKRETSSTLAAGASTAALRKNKSPSIAAARSSASASCLVKAPSELRTGGAAKRTVAVCSSRKASDTAPTSVADDSASVTPATPKRNRECGKPAHGNANDTKQRIPRSTSVAARGSSISGSAASKKNKASGNSSSSTGGCAAGSDSGSERGSYVRDPLKIRLPCNMRCRRRSGVQNGHHPMHVTVRWSGARQRRRRFFAQYPALTRFESAMPLPQSSCLAGLSLGSDGREVRVGKVMSDEEICYRMSKKEQSQGFAPPWVPRLENGLDAATVVGRSAQRPPSVVDDASLLSGTPRASTPLHQQQQQQCTSHREAGRTATATAATGKRDSLFYSSDRVIAHSHVCVRGQSEDEDIALSAAINDSNSAPPVLPFTRHSAQKSATILSQSTTTAMGTSALGISGSELPTPSSVDHFSAPPQSALPRPNSLLIVRSPPQDYADETVPSSLCYNSRQASVATNASSPLATAGPVSAHSFRGSPGGVGSASSLNHLRVTYVTDTVFSGTHARSTPHHSLHLSIDQGSSPHSPSNLTPANPCAPSGVSQSPHQPQQQGGGLHGLTRIRHPSSLKMSGRKLSDPMVSGHVWSNSDSPKQVNSATLRSSSGGGGESAHTRALFSTVQSPLLSLSSTPLWLTSLPASASATPALMMRSAHRSSSATSARGGQEVSTPLHVKTVMAQRCRSFLLRRQQQQHGRASSAHVDALGAPPVHVASNPSCDDSPPPHEEPQQLPVISPPLPPLAPQLLDTVPGGLRLLGVRRVTSARHRASVGDDADDEPRSLGSRNGTMYHYTSANAQLSSSHLPTTSSPALGRRGESFQPQQLRSDRPSHREAMPTIRLSGESPLHILAAGEGSINWSLASSMPLTRGDSSTDLREKSPRPWAYAPTRLYAASESTAWLENNGLTTVTATPAMSPLLGHGTATGHHASYFGNSNNPVCSEPATPLLLSQQRHFSGLARAHQQASSVSLTSTSFLSHQLALTSSFGTTGSAQEGARRTPSGLARAPSFSASTVTPAAAAPQVFCKYQRSEHQRRRRRLPPPLPGTRCPGMADRLAFDVYRAAVRSGVIAEEEECSYYLSHHRCTSASPIPSLSPPTSHSALCVVSLADCHIRSPPAPTLTSAAGHGCHTGMLWDDRHEEMEEVTADRKKTTVSTPSCLYHIPLCCDDVYHRDEEALEMLSVTTTSSCAFGAGLDGLCWQDWMPSSPVEAGEAILRAAEQAAAAAARATTSSHVWDSSRLSTIVNNSRGSQDALGSGLSAPPTAASVTTMDDSCATGSLTAAPFGVPSSSIGTSSRQTAGIFASRGTVTSAGITAPRNSEDLAYLSCRALDDAPAWGKDEDATDLLATLPIDCSDGDDWQLQRRLPHENVLNTRTSFDSGSNLNLSGSGKRPFIAEWIVSKLQKRMGKKKKRQREPVAASAAATAVRGRATPRVGNPPPPRLEAGSDPLPSQAQSRASGISEHSRRLPSLSIAMPTAADAAAQQHQRQRVAYLTAVYQTEFAIHEQKRREAEANRRGLEELMNRSRAKMTPAAAGYYYEPRVVTSPGISQRRAQPHNEPFGTLPLKPMLIDVEVAATTIRASGVGSSSCAATYRNGFSNESDKTDKAVEQDSDVSFRSPRLTLTPTSRADNKLFDVATQLRDGTAESTTEPAKRKPNDAAAPQEQRRSDLEGRTSKALTMASTAEAERRRVALETLRKKKQAIESWLFGLRS